MKTTGEKIREGRTHLGLTQTELGEKIGVTLRTISKYEKQGVMPRGVNLQKLAEVLGVSTAYLSDDEIVDPHYGLDRERKDCLWPQGCNRCRTAADADAGALCRRRYP